MQLNRALLEAVIHIAQKAGDITLKYYRQPLNIIEKNDHSPLTEADRAADHFIKGELAKISGLPYLSEEAVIPPYETRKKWNSYWLVDPLDGTKEFINQTNEFTINIALIKKGMPALGVVHAPALELTYAAFHGGGAYKIVGHDWKKMSCVERKKDELRVVASRSHLNLETQQYIDSLVKPEQKITLKSVGSSLKFCLVAEGVADIYPRFGETMEWDVAAAAAVCREAYAGVYQLNRKALKFNKPDLKNPYFIVEKSNEVFHLWYRSVSSLV